MIKAMTKYSFVIFHKEADAFLNSLQTLGLVDITRRNKAVDEVSKAQFDRIAAYNAAIRALEPFYTEVPQISGGVDADDNLLETAQEALKKHTELNKELAECEANFAKAKKWGDIEEKDLRRLSEMGYTPHFYTCSEKSFKEEWNNLYPIYELNRENGKLFFALIGEGNKETGFPLTEAQVPQKSASEYAKERENIENSIKENMRVLNRVATLSEKLVEEKNRLEEEIDKYIATHDAPKEAEDCIILFEGFAPTENDSQIEELLEREGVYYIKEKANEEDNPPIVLKNNWFTRLFEPIGDLYMLPKYGEVDLTPYFAPFYMLFFGLCLGDMGYGIVLLLAGLYVNFKMAEYKGYGQLVAWLGFGSIVMPALNGTFFGAKIYELFGMPESAKEIFFSDLKMFWFAIIFGLFQIVLARIMNAIFAIKQKGILAGLHNIGWAILIVWLSIAYAAGEVPFSYPAYVNYIGMGGLALILLFTSDNKNIFIKLFKGVSALYDITGVFGDMLSYIRLFGLGTAGGILGMVVNSVAMQMSEIPYLGWFFTGLMLIVGHTMVLLLSSLGAFVHPMRLTFVEFYKNAGFEGGGRAYNPLKNKVRK